MVNHVPSIPLDLKFLDEKWFEKDMNSSHLKVFGVVVYLYINETSIEKMDAKAK